MTRAEVFLWYARRWLECLTVVVFPWVLLTELPPAEMGEDHAD